MFATKYHIEFFYTKLNINFINFSKYILLILEESIYWSLIISCFMFFYSFYKKKLIKGGKIREKSGEEANLAKFSVVDVDIQQDESSSLSERKNPKEIINNSKNEPHNYFPS